MRCRLHSSVDAASRYSRVPNGSSVADFWSPRGEGAEAAAMLLL